MHLTRILAFASLAVAASLSLASGESAVAEKAAAPKLYVDGNIVPSYQSSTTLFERAANIGVKLTRVENHWKTLESRDLKAVRSKYKGKGKTKTAMDAKVKLFYKTAVTCLGKQNMKAKYKKKPFIKAMNQVKACIYPAAKTPANDEVDGGADEPMAITKEETIEDDVPNTNTDAPIAPTAIDQPDDGELLDDATGDDTPMMSPAYPNAEGSSTFSGGTVDVPTQNTPPQPDYNVPGAIDPSYQTNEAPVEQYEPMPDMPTDPDMPPQPDYNVPGAIDPSYQIDEAADQGRTNDIFSPTDAAPNPDSWPFSPASPDVPPRWALDWDRSGSIDFNEWQKYIERLHGLAMKAVTAGRDPIGVSLLATIVDFHYGALGTCITKKLKKENLAVLQSPVFEDVAHWVEANCYVKFRYSLFAGVPPFEWVAKDQPTVTATELEAWITSKVKTARSDLHEKHLFEIPADQEELIERFIGCTYQSLTNDGDSAIDHDAYYATIRDIEACVKK